MQEEESVIELDEGQVRFGKNIKHLKAFNNLSVTARLQMGLSKGGDTYGLYCSAILGLLLNLPIPFNNDLAAYGQSVQNYFLEKDISYIEVLEAGIKARDYFEKHLAGKINWGAVKEQANFS